MRRVLILDDDPTGTQTASDVDVLLRPSEELAEDFARSAKPSCYVLTNSRALSKGDAAALVERVAAVMTAPLRDSGIPHTVILRGDSTLRGHVFAEVDALAAPGSVTLFVPAFPEGGRVTVGGVHYLERAGRRVPVVDTEYAHDLAFGYASRTVVGWVAEVGDGRPAISIGLSELRAQGPTAVSQLLLTAPPGTVVIPDAECRSDLEIVAAGLRAAERQRPVTVRSAATFASIYAGLRPRLVERVDSLEAGPLLVVCGSYTTGANAQLDRFVEHARPPVIAIPQDAAVSNDPNSIGRRAGHSVSRALERAARVVLCTPRQVVDGHADPSAGARMMQALTAAAAEVAKRLAGVVVKGGITSAQVATDGFGGERARVIGQVDTGVPLWELTTGWGSTIPYAVVPGNVGDDETLVRVVGAFMQDASS